MMEEHSLEYAEMVEKIGGDPEKIQDEIEEPNTASIE